MGILYKPKFCCECGEKVERAEWRLWTNRRFCEFCETEFQGEEIGRKMFAAFGAFAIIAGVFGIYGASRLTPHESSSASATITADAKSDTAEKSRPLESREQRRPETVPAEQANAVTVSSVPVYGEPEKAAKAVYYCGALTRKGTACSRRVKEKGHRCWQHSASLNH